MTKPSSYAASAVTGSGVDFRLTSISLTSSLTQPTAKRQTKENDKKFYY